MSRRGKSSLIESALVLALMGIVAGAVGGFAVGIVTTPKASSATTSTAK
ncbi:MAG: hypothetical protein ABR874_16470 [Candidatus Sulfotelmatobacter sp.]|jgi:type II secretory pathway pseudopilin PulG